MGYADTDWRGDLDKRKYVFGYIFLLNNRVISCNSKKQCCIILSTMKAKFMAFSATAQETIWLRRFLNHLSFYENETDSVLIHNDSQQQSLIQKISSITQKSNTLILSIISLET
jgi:hypothetical protein